MLLSFNADSWLSGYTNRRQSRTSIPSIRDVDQIQYTHPTCRGGFADYFSSLSLSLSLCLALSLYIIYNIYYIFIYIYIFHIYIVRHLGNISSCLLGPYLFM